MSSIHLTAELEEKLSNLVSEKGHTKFYYVREAILRFLEDIEDEKLALERLKNPSYCSLEELEAELRLDN